MPHPDFDGVFARFNAEQMKKDRRKDSTAAWRQWLLIFFLGILPGLTLWVLL